MDKTVGGNMIYLSGYRVKTDQDSCSQDTKNYFSVNCCGYEKYLSKNIDTLRVHGRLDFQLIYVVNGYGSFLVKEKFIELTKGTVLIYPPGETQQYSYRYENSTEVFWVHFTGYGAQELLENIGLKANEPHYIGLNNTFIDCFTKVIHELQIKLPLFEQASNFAILDLLTLMARTKLTLQASPKRIQDEPIIKVMEEMHTHYSYNWTISKLAKQCNLSVDWFMHRFKAQSGVSAMEYLLEIRLNKAKWLLLNSSLSIKEISNIVGYSDPLYFSRVFKKSEGISANIYRKSHS